MLTAKGVVELILFLKLVSVESGVKVNLKVFPEVVAMVDPKVMVNGVVMPESRVIT